ncbi:hypothetical protein D9611_006344 [Ephemerocybe angulata]|uniref:Uncharacterized protein n=1 Tax=Ephemerocybe angulata TaxID=980116 RepID=A0A8H5C791_9AGAR|nr:hypothetical protein D9611_006344 [Tulosesus angulatus]
MPHYADDDELFSSPNFHPARGAPSRQAVSGRRSSASLRGASSLANDFNDDAAAAPANGRHHSLAHELAVALMPEPSAGSKLLAEEFGIEFDEGAEGIDEDVEQHLQQRGDRDQSHISEHNELDAQSFAAPSDPRPSFADELGGGHDALDAAYAGESSESALAGGLSDDAVDEAHMGGNGGDLDPVFDSPSISRTRPRQKTPEKDAMDVLSENVQFTDNFLAQLRTLDTEPGTSSSQQPKLERLASDVIRRMNESVRDRESQVRVLLECEREFRKIGGEVGGSDVLGQLEELEEVEQLSDDPVTSPTPNSSSPPQQHYQPRSLHTLLEEEQPSRRPGSHRRQSSYANDWELDPERSHLGDYEDSEPSTSPIRTSFAPPPILTGAPTPAKLVPQLTHIRSFTSSTISSLSSISEHAQVNGVATADAGRKIRSLKNKLGSWKTEWESAERSRAKIERWEAGILDTEGPETLPTSAPSTPTRFASRRVDGRKLVQEQLQAFELALADAALKTQAIMAR